MSFSVRVWIIVLGDSRGRFQGLYLPSLCISCVAINKNLNNGHHSFIRQRWKFCMISVAMTSEPHSNEMTSLPILLAAVFHGTGRSFLKSFTGAFSSNSRFDFLEVWAKSMTGLSRYFWDKFLIRNSANSE